MPDKSLVRVQEQLNLIQNYIERELGNRQITFTSSTNPSTGAGLAAPVGCFLWNPTTGARYEKFDVADTDWRLLPTQDTGTIFLNGSGVPNVGLGANGNYYVDSGTQDVYFKASGAWAKIGSLTGDGVGTVWLSASGVPDNSLGSNGNYYRDTATQDIYYKAAGAWTLIGSLLGGGGGGSALDPAPWDLAANSALPLTAEVGRMYQMATGGNRDGQHFVAGDISIVNLDGLTISNLTNKNVSATNSVYATLDSDVNLVGTLSNGGLTITQTGPAAAKATVAAAAAKCQMEVTIDTVGDGALFFGCWENTITLTSLFATANDNGFFVVYAPGDGWVEFRLTAGGAPASAAITGWSAPSSGDVVTFSYDSATRGVQVKLNGVVGTLTSPTVPGSAAVYFATGQNGGTTQLVHTVDFGPTFTYPFSTYVGIYELVASFYGVPRFRSETWVPSAGYPNPADKLPGDVWFTSAAGTVPADGELYFQGEGTWWDGGAYRHLNDSPLQLGTLSWGGDLVGAYNWDYDYYLLTAGPAAEPEGVVYRIGSGTTYHITDAAYLVAMYPEGTLVTVVNGRYEVMAYSDASYPVPREGKFADSARVFVGPYFTPDPLLNPMMGASGALSAGGQFEFTITALPVGGALGGQIGVFLPFNPSATVSTQPSARSSPTLDWQWFLFYDFQDNFIKYSYFDTGTTLAVTTTLVDMSSAPLEAGETLTFISQRSSDNNPMRVSVYRGDVALLGHVTPTPGGTNIDLFGGSWTYGLAAFKDYQGGSFSQNPTVRINTGSTPFNWIYPTALTSSAFKYGYPVRVKSAQPVLSINGFAPNISGELTLPLGDSTHFVTMQPTTALGVDGDYALEPTKGRLYGPKSAGTWGGTDLSELTLRAGYGTQLDTYTVRSNAEATFFARGLALTETTGKRQLGFKFSGAIGGSSVTVNIGGVDASWGYVGTAVVQLSRVSGAGTLYFAGIGGSETCVVDYAEGEEWLVILDYDAETATVIAPNGAQYSNAVTGYLSGIQIRPAFVSGTSSVDIDVQLQPDGNSLTPSWFTGQGWQTTPNPFVQVNEPYKRLGGCMPQEAFPVVRIGPVGVANNTNGVLATGALFIQPIIVHESMSMTVLSVRCTNFAGAANVRLGLYASYGGRPTQRLAASGDIAVSGTGLVEAAIQRWVTPGRYWLAMSTSVSGNTYNCVNACDGQMGRSSTSTSSAPITGFYRAFTHAALPADETDQVYLAASTTGSMPIILAG